MLAKTGCRRSCILTHLQSYKIVTQTLDITVYVFENILVIQTIKKGQAIKWLIPFPKTHGDVLFLFNKTIKSRHHAFIEAVHRHQKSLINNTATLCYSAGLLFLSPFAQTPRTFLLAGYV